MNTLDHQAHLPGSQSQVTPTISPYIGAPERITHQSGLDVMMLSMPTCSTARVVISTLVGALAETPDISGIYHLMEHCVADGSTRGTPLDRIVHRWGGEYNASAGYTTTNYYLEVPSQYFVEAFRLLCRQLTEPDLSNEHIAQQKRIIGAENLGWSSHEKLDPTRALTRASFPFTRLSQRADGEQDTLTRISPELVRQLYEDTFTTGRLNVSVYGNFNPWEVRRVLDEFGWRQGGNAKRENAPVEYVFPGRRLDYARCQRDADAGSKDYSANSLQGGRSFVLGFRLVGAEDRDSLVPWGIASGLLASDTLGVLNDTLRRKHQLVYSVRSVGEQLARDGCYGLAITCPTEAYQKVLALSVKAVRELFESGPTQEAVDMATEGWRNRILFRMTTPGDFDSWYKPARYLARSTPHLTPMCVADRCREMTRQSAHEAIRRHFNPDQMRLLVLEGDGWKSMNDPA